MYCKKDLNYFKFVLFFIILSGSFQKLQSQIAINEIQASPVGDEPEWVEIYNYSDKPFQFQSAWFSDAVSFKKIPDITINQGQYAIFTKDTLTLKTIRSIPHSTLFVEFSLPALNNTWDCLALRNSDSSIIDSIYYNMSWGSKGISLERVDCKQSAFDNKNWLPSKSKDSATCGYSNSVTRKNFDLKVQNLNYYPNKSFQIEIINEGKQSSTEAECIFEIYNIKTKKQLKFQVPILQPQAHFSYMLELDSLNLSNLFNGENSCLAICKLSNDEDRSNDTLKTEIYISYPYRTILINEFLFESGDFSSDFVELYNSSEDTIYLKNWLIHDKTVTTKADTFKITNDCYIEPNDYFVVAFDSTFFNKFPELFGLDNIFVKKSSFNLNADEDEIVIKDPNKNTLDSLKYNKKWHLAELDFTKDVSLEKINPTLLSNIKESWTSSTAPKGATPAKENSILQPIEHTGTLLANPNPFSPFSNDKDHFCLISYVLPFNQAKIRTIIFNLNGERVRELSNLEISSAQGHFVWDGKNDSGFNLEVGPYILMLEAIDLITGNVFNEKLVIVIGK